MSIEQSFIVMEYHCCQLGRYRNHLTGLVGPPLNEMSDTVLITYTVFYIFNNVGKAFTEAILLSTLHSYKQLLIVSNIICLKILSTRYCIIYPAKYSILTFYSISGSYFVSSSLNSLRFMSIAV